MTAHLGRDVERHGWVVLDDEETVLFGPSWSITALSEWCKENGITLRSGETNGKEQGQKPSERVQRPNNRQDAGQQSSATNSAEPSEEKEEEVTQEET